KQKNIAENKASDYLRKLNSKLEDLVASRTATLEKANSDLALLASQDSLTGLLNHRSSINQVSKALNEANRYNISIAVIMIDLDNFKLLNDQYGHQVGDEAIVSVSQVLRSNLRDTDSCGRYGGEEFILIITRTDLDEVNQLAERLKSNIAEIHLSQTPDANVTASFGIAMCLSTQCEEYTTDSLISAADSALYKAKLSGRNKICFTPSNQMV
ncbi:MAG: GGDEF domain-containing protein, partial [Oceanicoccus sp.]|uniref:GGDEF domain-containing protein n=1 Tax=Oceanicoccus sp. TaxID=2691044 RepID=UPI00262B261B